MVNLFLKPGLHKAKSQNSKEYTEATLFPVFPLEELLPEVEKNHYLNKVQELAALPDDYFRVIYEELIDNFALFVQILPERYGEELGGLLNDGLRRGLLTIQLLHENQQSKRHPLFVFAVFSIALLADVGQIINYQTKISDENGAFIADWCPYLGYLNEFGEYFKLRPYEDTPGSLVRGATPLLARQLLNETTMAWLSSNNQIFDMWLAFLHKGEEWAGLLAKILKIDPKQFENKREQLGIIPLDVKITEPIETDLGEKFWAWLKNGIEEGAISYNEVDSKVHIVKTNEYDLSVFLQAPELFQQFCNVYSKTQNWVVVCKQFNMLGLTELSGGDLKLRQFFTENIEAKASKLGFLSKSANRRGSSPGRSMKEGVVVKDAKNLFGSKPPPVSQYLKEMDMRSKLENLLPKLNQSGSGPAPQIKV